MALCLVINYPERGCQKKETKLDTQQQTQVDNGVACNKDVDGVDVNEICCPESYRQLSSNNRRYCRTLIRNQITKELGSLLWELLAFGKPIWEQLPDI